MTGGELTGGEQAQRTLITSVCGDLVVESLAPTVPQRGEAGDDACRDGRVSSEDRDPSDDDARVQHEDPEAGPLGPDGDTRPLVADRDPEGHLADGLAGLAAVQEAK